MDPTGASSSPPLASWPVGEPQPAPSPRAAVGPSVQELVRRDLEMREQLGVERYGTSLYPRNGRDALLDAYEESLDLACYLRQALEEKHAPHGRCADCGRPLHPITLPSSFGPVALASCPSGPHR